MSKLHALCDLSSFFINRFSKPVGISIDITHRCNLKCKHCYFWKYGYKNELSDNDWLNKLSEIKRHDKSIKSAYWVGGEPLLRKNLIKKGMPFFNYNIIFTNGMLSLPKWKCRYKVSVDGTKKEHEEIRGKNTYEKVKQNSDRSDIPIDIVCTLNRWNYKCMEALIKEWSKTNIKGIHFSFYTPVKGIKYKLWLNFKERDKIIEKLRLLKREYGDFILLTDKVLSLMLSKNCKNITDNCLFEKGIISLGPTGKRKICPIGNLGDCSRCGSLDCFFMAALNKRDIETFKLLTQQGFPIC